MKVMPGSRGWATAARYIATRQGGYPDGPRTTGRSIPSPGTETRVARLNVKAPQRIEVPLTTLTMKLDLRAAGQILIVSQGSNVSVWATVPVVEVTTEGGRATIVPTLEHVPFRIWTAYVARARRPFRL